MGRKPELFMNHSFGMKIMSEVFQEGNIVSSSKKRLNKFSKNSLYLAGKAESKVFSNTQRFQESSQGVNGGNVFSDS